MWNSNDLVEKKDNVCVNIFYTLHGDPPVDFIIFPTQEMKDYHLHIHIYSFK